MICGFPNYCCWFFSPPCFCQWKLCRLSFESAHRGFHLHHTVLCSDMEKTSYAPLLRALSQLNRWTIAGQRLNSNWGAAALCEWALTDSLSVNQLTWFMVGVTMRLAHKYKGWLSSSFWSEMLSDSSRFRFAGMESACICKCSYCARRASSLFGSGVQSSAWWVEEWGVNSWPC